MGEAVEEQRVICHQCRYRFLVEVTSVGNWQIEAQCPSCESWACFGPADTHDLPWPDPAEPETRKQLPGKVLWGTINEHRGHPAVAWMDRVGNGLFEPFDQPPDQPSDVIAANCKKSQAGSVPFFDKRDTECACFLTAHRVCLVTATLHIAQSGDDRIPLT